ncbi:hypothetical protein DESUT3_05300 [Desulfuromonas versatilis]|uniref:VWFA domain-containing protein n=2 Tax=Desulfuromonas versatilis TaxID=2802975 RepID=A0ABM8HSL9_9BACT|nr:hypothetical protein DESUT3_05300 [Desulfuromonas versatilis]
MAYGVKAKLSSALDAAAIAAAKASSGGEAQARQAADKFFAANFPDGYLGSHPALGEVRVATNRDTGTVSVTVDSSATVPTAFMRVLGMDNIEVAARAQVVRQDLDMAFVVDNTTSLRQGSLGDVTDDVIRSAKAFIDKFNQDTDRVALIKYAYGAEVPVEIKKSGRGFEKNRIRREIERFNFGTNSNPNFTNSCEGFWRAKAQLESISTNRSSIRAIVFFTDGAPNTFSSTFVFDGPWGDGRTRSGSLRSGDNLPDPDNANRESGLWDHTRINSSIGSFHNFSRYVRRLPPYYDPRRTGDSEFRLFYPGSRRATSSAVDYDNINRISRNLLEDMAAAARRSNIYVFTLGLGSRLRDPSGPDSENGEDLLLRMANDRNMLGNKKLAADFRADEVSGLYCHAADESELDACYDRLASAIMRLTM